MAGEGAKGTILTWNVENWVTVTLMALVTFGGWGLAQSWYTKRKKAAA